MNTKKPQPIRLGLQDLISYSLLLCDFNSSATVERYRRNLLYATVSLCLNLITVYTHVNEVISNTVCTTLRKSLVEFCRTGSAIAVTCYENIAVVLLSILSNSLYVYEISLRSNLILTDIEEYRYRSCNEFLNSLCFCWPLVSEHILKTIVLCVSVVELSVQSVNLRL